MNVEMLVLHSKTSSLWEKIDSKAADDSSIYIGRVRDRNKTQRRILPLRRKIASLPIFHLLHCELFGAFLFAQWTDHFGHLDPQTCGQIHGPLSTRRQTFSLSSGQGQAQLRRGQAEAHHQSQNRILVLAVCFCGRECPNRSESAEIGGFR